MKIPKWHRKQLEDNGFEINEEAVVVYERGTGGIVQPVRGTLVANPDDDEFVILYPTENQSKDTANQLQINRSRIVEIAIGYTKPTEDDE